MELNDFSKNKLGLEDALAIASSKNGKRFRKFVWYFLTYVFGRFYCKVNGVGRVS